MRQDATQGEFPSHKGTEEDTRRHAVTSFLPRSNPSGTSYNGDSSGSHG